MNFMDDEKTTLGDLVDKLHDFIPDMDIKKRVVFVGPANAGKIVIDLFKPEQGGAIDKGLDFGSMPIVEVLKKLAGSTKDLPVRLAAAGGLLHQLGSAFDFEHVHTAKNGEKWKVKGVVGFELP
jgi:hypothetical protein